MGGFLRLGCRGSTTEVTLPPTFIERERTSGLSFAQLGRLVNEGGRGALRIAQRQALLQGEGSCELRGGLPAEAEVGPFGAIVRAPDGGRDAGTGTGSRSRVRPVSAR